MSDAQESSSSSSSSEAPVPRLAPFPFSRFARQIADELEGRRWTSDCPHKDHKGMKGDGVPKYTCLDCKLMFCKEHFKKGAVGRCLYCIETLRMHNIPSFMQDLDNMDGMAAEDIDFSINVDKNHEAYKAGDRLRVGPRLQAKLRCKEYMEVVKQDTAKGDHEKAEDLAEKLPYEWCMIPEDDYASVGDRALNQIGNSLQEEEVSQKRRYRIMRLMKVKRMVESKLERLYYKTIEIPEEKPAQSANPN